MSAIFKRRSVREFKENFEVTSEDLKEILKAGMCAPTARNCQDWEFIISKDRNILKKIISVHSTAKMLESASLVILACANINEALEGYWVQDVTASIMNILTRAKEIELDTCWIGVHPDENREEAMKDIFGLPDNIKPVGLIAVGKAKELKEKNNRYISSKVHLDKYGENFIL